MIIMIKVLIYLFIVPSIMMILIYMRNLFLTRKYFKDSSKHHYDVKLDKKINMIAIIPCLREQNVITESIEYFLNMNLDNVNLYLLIACTKRENLTNLKYGFDVSTADVAREYLKGCKLKENCKCFIYEANDINNGDRATQMNFAVDTFINEHKYIDIDIIAAFDADSRPSVNTFNEVAVKFRQKHDVCYQQPDVYVGSANNIYKEKGSLLATANAIYQNEWTMISEIPMLMKYGKSNGNYKWYFYCNGHGEFFPYEIWKNYRFPEYEVTDGIHIGYRLGMSGAKVQILDNYGNTDAPHTLRALPKQHKRWYGGCMRLNTCYKWCNKQKFKPKKTMVLAGYWSQFRWAFTANLFIINLILSIILFALFGDFIPFTILVSLLLIYCYIFGFISLKISPVKNNFNFLSFLLIPVAMWYKSIGANLFIFESIIKRKKIKYEKVER